MTVDLMKAPKLSLDFQRDLSSFSSTSSGLGLSTSSVYSSLESLVLQTPDVTDMDLTNSTAKVESSKEYLDLNQFSW